VRRVALMMWEDGRVYYSDPLLATLLYLQTHGLDYGLDEANPKDLRLGKSTLRPFAPNDGAYVNADAHGYQILLDFSGPEEFPTFSLSDVLAGNVSPDAIRGNVVMLGPLASSLKDFLSCPVSKRFPGLMLHAHVVNQLLRHAVDGQRPLRFWKELQEAAWVLAWCVAGTLAGSNVRSPFVFLPVAGACLGALFAIYWVALLANLWLLVITPGVAFTCAAALSTSHQAYLEKKQRAVLMQLFSQHVSANIAADIWDHREQFMEGHRPKPQVLTGTVFFSDLKGFTRMAETLPPDVLIDWLNEYMEIMASLIEQHGGMINKYMGDAIMAVFGAPIPRTTEQEIQQDATNAVRCALAMAEQLDGLNADWEKRGLPTTTMRIGIATGPLVSGSIGGSKRLEYTVTGDTVVVAKRLESADKNSTSLEKASLSCRILITEKTSAMLGPQFKVRAVGPMRLEGRNQTVGVFVAIGEEGPRKR
jgi:adenylate cyclase